MKLKTFISNACIIFFMLVLFTMVPAWAGTKIVYENEIFNQTLRLYLENDEVLIMNNCYFDGGELRVRGKGNVFIDKCIFQSPPRSAMDIMVDGYVSIQSVDIYGTGTTPNNHRYSGLTLHGATQGGLISNVIVTDFPGNGILVEASLPINRVKFSNIQVYDCGGGMWLFNADGCKVDGFYSENSDYKQLRRFAYRQAFPCILDEVVVDGERYRGNTLFRNITCY
ncbi:MAG: hypothetical protein HF978_00050 [Desulfobacteraceae bacterium]|nr:right-handed parallel beta-helix repeat-containing protein [Desulfobacteraceae bacterium]MBC2753926.1 hypothetical protein [Desulfobacteraceae bacterium]